MQRKEVVTKLVDRQSFIIQETHLESIQSRASSTGIGTGNPGTKLSTGTRNWNRQEPGNVVPKNLQNLKLFQPILDIFEFQFLLKIQNL